MAVNKHRRLDCDNIEMLVDPGHIIVVSLAYDESDVLREVCFVSRGKAGHGIDILLHDLGIKLSRAIQGRHPNIEQVPPSTELFRVGPPPGDH